MFGVVEDETGEVVQEGGEVGGETGGVIDIGFGAVWDRDGGGGRAGVVLCACAEDDGAELEAGWGGEGGAWRG